MQRTAIDNDDETTHFQHKYRIFRIKTDEEKAYIRCFWGCTAYVKDGACRLLGFCSCSAQPHLKLGTPAARELALEDRNLQPFTVAAHGLEDAPSALRIPMPQATITRWLLLIAAQRSGWCG